MAERFRVTLAQLDPTVGDLAGNAEKARDAWRAGQDAGADLVALPEMFVTGYQPQDLVMKPAFVQAAMAQIAALARDCADGPALSIGAPAVGETGRMHNAYFLLQGGRIAGQTHKFFLPNFNVFDEVRVFSRDRMQGPVDVDGVRIGMPVCEDAWYPDVVEAMEESGAEFLLVPNGSPYFRNKYETRLNKMVARTVESGLPLIYLNMVGAQDDQIFDGGSFVLNPHGSIVTQLPVFEEAVAHVDLIRGAGGWQAEPGPFTRHPDEWEQDYHAMVRALRDYTRKAGFPKVLLGLSGGIDSALVAAIAVDALGAANVRCVMLPSEYTSAQSLEDAEACAAALGCHCDHVPISQARSAVTATLEPLFKHTRPGIAEENIQSRLRGLLLMALSNKFGEMLLTTGNKSEVAVGYATLYGDMSGGYNPIKDLYKTRVFETCRWRNANHRPWMQGPAGDVIPERIISKPPSAELRADQKDSDSLPDYAVLDGMLEILVDQDGSVADCVAEGYDRAEAKRVEHLLYVSEYKRFQAAPGARLTPRAFWLDRRYPIVNRWRDEG
jgi:NAD+ synthase